MPDPRPPFLVAAIQASPVLLDLAATLDKACALIAEAGARGARVVVFPECFLPGFPLWVWWLPAGQTQALRELHQELVREAVEVPGPAVERLGAAARAAGTAVIIGVNERNAEASGTSLYNATLTFGPDGRLLGRHRKLVPTTGERLVYAPGDASGLVVHATPQARIGGLICWENYMPLALYALYAAGIEVWAAPTWDRGEPWQSTLRHIAKEGRCYVIGCGMPLRKADVPDRLPFKAAHLAGADEWLNPGGSLIADPDGKLLAGPAVNEETILYAECSPARLSGARFQLDVAGHYARPDIFRMSVDRRKKPVIEEVGDGGAGPGSTES